VKREQNQILSSPIVETRRGLFRAAERCNS